jgi:subtilisin-like proprotein convertase family protein
VTTTHRLRALVTALLGAALAAALTGVPAPAAVAATTDAANPTAIDVPDSNVYRKSSTSIAIPDSGMAATYPSQVSFSGVVGTVTEVSVQLHGLQHGSLDDLDIMLVGPGGQNVLLMSDAGGGSASDLTMYFDDDMPSSLPDSTVPAYGYYRPTNYGAGDAFPAPAPAPTGSALSVFDGTDPNGVWQLYIVDDSAGQSGSLNAGWLLVVRTTKTTSVYPAPITVSDLSGPVTDVDVTLHGLTHTFAADLDVLLVGPGGRRALVMSDVGKFDEVAGVDLVLDDEGASPLPTNALLQSGTFRPTDSDTDEIYGETDDFIGAPGSTTGDGSALSVFDGTDPNGTWKLYVVDDAADDVGSIAGGWSLHITTADPAPDPAPAPAPAPGSATPPSAGGSDTVHPRVGATTPGAGATKVRPGKNIRAKFSEPVRRATLTSASVKLVRKGTTVRIPATLTYDRATHTVTINPSRRLRHHTTYKVMVTTAVKDIAGNALDQKPSIAGNQKARWTFTTASGVVS